MTERAEAVAEAQDSVHRRLKRIEAKLDYVMGLLMPPMLVAETPTTPEEIERIRDWLNEHYSSESSRHKPIILNGDMRIERRLPPSFDDEDEPVQEEE